jgi:hypothetical protein
MTEFERNILILAGVLGGALVLILALALALPHIPVRTIRQMVVGVKAPPILVASVRRLLTALGSAAVTAALAWLGAFETGELAAIAAAAAGVLEVGWGLLDQTLKHDQNAINPPPVAGSGGGNPAT